MIVFLNIWKDGFDCLSLYLLYRVLELARRVDPISVTVSPKVLHVLLDQKAQFKCRAKSVTEYTLQWTQGVYGALPDGAENDNGVLTIDRARAIHGGSYTCTGKNANNEDMVTVQLRIGGKNDSYLVA